MLTAVQKNLRELFLTLGGGSKAPLDGRAAYANAASHGVLGLGLVALLFAASRGGGDFGPMHLMGVAVVRGLPIYDRAFQLQLFANGEYPGPPQGMFYPPATGVALLPLAWFSFRIAQHVWCGLTMLAIVFGVRALLKAARPDLQPRAWRFAAGFVMLSAGVRWGITPGQGAPLVLGLLCLFMAQLFNGNRWWAIAIAAFALAFKFTLAVPFLLLLLCFRNYRGLVLCAGTWVVSNAVGLYRVGGLTAMHDYKMNIATVEALGDINTPDPWAPISVPRTDLSYLAFGVLRNLPLARTLAQLACVVIAVVLIWLAWRLGPHPTLRQAFGYLLVGTCLGAAAVYHHHYDWAVLIAPLLLGCLLQERSGLKRTDWLLLSPMCAMLAFLPIALAQRLLIDAFGSRGVVLLNFSFPVLTLVGIGVGLLSLFSGLRRSSAGLESS